MAEIGRIFSLLKLIRLWFPMFALLHTHIFTGFCTAQDIKPKPDQGKKIEILSFGKMGRNSIIDPDLTIFIGNVRIKHNEAIMFCDSAHHYDVKNLVEAFGRVHISQGDTLNLFGDYIFYDGNTENAFIRGNVKLIDKETSLFTDRLNYRVNERTAFYDTEGRIINGDDVMESRKGVYFAGTRMFHFSESIEITGPDYVISADTMNYSIENEIVYFTGPTRINGDSIKIFALGGWYDSREKTSRIWSNAMVDNYKQVIEGDTLYYEETEGYAEATGNICITDTANSSVIKGNYAIYHKDPESIFVTDRALYILEGDADTLFMHADTLRAITIAHTGDSVSTGYRLVKAYYGTRIFSHDFQSCADSLSYSFRDSTIRMYGNPVIWSEENQMTADSILLFTLNNHMDKMELYSGAFVISRVDSLNFNQIKGRSVTGYFENNRLVKVLVEGNGESVYYLVDRDEMIGVNYSKSSNMLIIVNDGKIMEVTEYGNPDGILDPPFEKTPEEMKLYGFKWLGSLRPAGPDDLFRKK